MEDDLNLLKMEDDLNFFKWKTTSILLKMEDDHNFSKMECRLISFENGRHPQFFVNKIIMQPETFKIKTMVVAPLRVT